MYNKSILEYAAKPTRRKFSDLEKAVFHRLTVLGYAGANKHGQAQWFCECICGTTTRVAAQDLIAGHTKSCGCWKIEATGNRSRTHGQTRTPEYRAFAQIRERVSNPKARFWKDYGGRGIKLCDGWSAFSVFIADVGKRPSPEYSLDRLDVNGHYSCGKCSQCATSGWVANCKWSTRTEQANNKRTTRKITFNGKTQSVPEWCRELHLKPTTINMRLRYGWTAERALTFSSKPISKQLGEAQ